MVTGISRAPSFYVRLLHVESFPFISGSNPDFSKDAFGLRDFAAGFALVLRYIGNQRRVRCGRFDGEVTEGVTDEFKPIHGVDFRLLVTESAETLLELAELVV